MTSGIDFFKGTPGEGELLMSYRVVIVSGSAKSMPIQCSHSFEYGTLKDNMKLESLVVKVCRSSYCGMVQSVSTKYTPQESTTVKNMLKKLIILEKS